jgi:hypothetical protein
VVLERDRYVSFANCGSPYHIGGAIPGLGSLLQTPESPETYACLTLQVNTPGGPGSRAPCVRARLWRADSAESARHRPGSPPAPT